MHAATGLGLVSAALLLAAAGLPALQRPVADLPVAARIAVSGKAFWIETTGDAVWVTGSEPNVLRRIDPRSNKVVASTALPGVAVAGMASGFGSLWVPLLAPGKEGKRSLARIDLKTLRLTPVLGTAPPDEGGIAVAGDSVWMTDGESGRLLRIDPVAGRVRQTIKLCPSSSNPVLAGRELWVSCPKGNLVSIVDVASGKLLGTVPSGRQPRFLTAGAGSVWVLGQGDGKVVRIDAAGRRPVATIALGIPGHGGDMSFDGRLVWATAFDVPLSAIDPASNRAVAQWVGPGGDSLRAGHGALWVTDFERGSLWRVAVAAASPKL